jgi:hypothetical protein
MDVVAALVHQVISAASHLIAGPDRLQAHRAEWVTAADVLGACSFDYGRSYTGQLKDVGLESAFRADPRDDSKLSVERQRLGSLSALLF